MFKTLIWERRYYAPGLFELHAAAEFFELMNAGKYLYRNDRDELGVILEVNYSRDAKGVRTACCKGYFAEALLNDRVLDAQICLTGSPEHIGRHLVQHLVIEPADPDRKMPDIMLGQVNHIGTGITVTAIGDKLGDKLYDIERTQEQSHRLRYDYLTNELQFEVWKGKDRTDTQTENSWAIFSDRFRNVKNAIYDRDESNSKNVAYVAGEGEGADRTIVQVDLRRSADEARRELYVDARDLKSTYTDEDGAEHTYAPDQYRALLRQRGLEKLAEYEKIETVSSDIDPTANLTYRVDFDLGDLCTFRLTDVGIEATKRITEIREVYEGNKQTLSVVFGNDQITSITKIIQREVL